MNISKKDFERLCDLARELNEMELNEQWGKLNKIIENIK